MLVRMINGNIHLPLNTMDLGPLEILPPRHESIHHDFSPRRWVATSQNTRRRWVEKDAVSSYLVHSLKLAFVFFAFDVYFWCCFIFSVVVLLWNDMKGCKRIWKDINRTEYLQRTLHQNDRSLFLDVAGANTCNNIWPFLFCLRSGMAKKVQRIILIC